MTVCRDGSQGHGDLLLLLPLLTLVRYKLLLLLLLLTAMTVPVCDPAVPDRRCKVQR
jgi:hypothetical protein